MTDAATRFYQRSHELNAALRPGSAPNIDEATLAHNSHRYAAAFRFLCDRPGQKAVELGYGGADVAVLLARHAAEYHIVDIVDRAGEMALPGNVHSVVANLDNDFPFADAGFDVVIAMMVIEHLYDPFHSFAEIARIVRPGGHIFINLPNIGALRCRLQLMAGRMPVTSSPDWFEKREWDGNHLHYFTVKDVRRIAELVGLQLVSMHPVGKMAAIKALRPALLCHEITFTLRKP